MLEYENPFGEKEKNLVHLTSRHVLDEIATKSVRIARKTGNDLYVAFVKKKDYRKNEIIV